MKNPGPEVQKAIYDALKAAPALAGGRIYDSVPEGAQFPYVTIGGEQTVDDGNGCGDGWEVFADVNVWSRQPGFPEAKALAAAVADRIRAITTVPVFALVEVQLTGELARRDPDGKTSRVILTFRFLIDEA